MAEVVFEDNFVLVFRHSSGPIANGPIRYNHYRMVTPENFYRSWIPKEQ